MRLTDQDAVGASLWEDDEGNTQWHLTNGTTTLNYKIVSEDDEFYPTRTLPFEVPEVCAEVYTVTLKHMLDGVELSDSSKTFRRIGGYEIDLDSEVLDLGTGVQYIGRDRYEDQQTLTVSAACDGAVITYQYESGYPVTVYYKELGTDTELHDPQRATCKDGQSVTLYSPAIEGYVLNQSQDAQVTLDQNNRSTTVYYVKEQYQVTYAFADPHPEIDAPVDSAGYTMFEGNNQATILGVSEPEHWTFQGWTVDGDDSGRIYQAGEVLTITGNVHLIGAWKQAEYKLDIVYILDQTAYDAYLAAQEAAEAEVLPDDSAVPQEWDDSMAGERDLSAEYDDYKADQAIQPEEEGGAVTYPEEMLTKDAFVAEIQAQLLAEAQEAAGAAADEAAAEAQQANLRAFEATWAIGTLVADGETYDAYNGAEYTSDFAAGSYVFAQQDPSVYYSDSTTTIEAIELGAEFTITPPSYTFAFTDGKDKTAAFHVGNNKFNVIVNHQYYKGDALVSQTDGTAQFVNGGDDFTVETAPKDGYDYVNNDLNLDLTSGEADITVTNENVVVTIRYQAQQRTVEFVFEGDVPAGQDTPAQQTPWYGDKAARPQVTVPAHYTFDGWYLKSVEEGEDVYTKYDFEAGVTENLTLYGTWSKTPYTVTFNFKGQAPADAATKPGNQTKYAGETAADPDYSYENNDPAAVYTFDGWYTEGSQVKYDFTTPITGDLDLYGAWSKSAAKYDYSVEYYLDGAYVGTLESTTPVEYGNAVAASAVNGLYSGTAKGKVQLAEGYSDAYMNYVNLDSAATVGIDSIKSQPEENVAKLYFTTQTFTVTVTYRYFAPGSTTTTNVPEDLLGKANPTVVTGLKYGEDYAIVSPAIPHYKLNTGSLAVVDGAIVGQNVNEYVDYVERGKYTVRVEYYDIADKENEDAVAIADAQAFRVYDDDTLDIPDEYTKDKTIANYDYVETVGNTTGLTGSATIQVYFQRQRYNLTVEHKDATENPDYAGYFSSSTSSIAVGTDTAASPVSPLPSGYKLIGKTYASDNAESTAQVTFGSGSKATVTGAVKDETITVTYTYAPKGSASLTVKYQEVDDQGNVVGQIEQDGPTIYEEDDAYSVSAKDITGFTYQAVDASSDPVSGTMGKGSDVVVILNYIRNSYAFHVEYYKDSLSQDHRLDAGSLTTSAEAPYDVRLTEGLVGTYLNDADWLNALRPTGYRSGSAQYVTIGVDPELNVVTVLYTKQSDPGGEDPGDDTFYTIIVEYREQGSEDELADQYTISKAEFTSYDVTRQSKKAIAGYAIADVTGDELKGRVDGDKLITVWYTNNDVDIPDEPTPADPGPVDPGPVDPAPVDPTPVDPKPVDPTPEDGSDVIIVDEETPLGNLPQTGTTAAPVDPSITLGLMALGASMAAAGLVFVIGRKKEEEN